MVPVELTIRFSPSDGSVGWINGVALMPDGAKTGPRALGRTDGKLTVTASFRAVETGRVYIVYASSGLERRPVGRIDLRNASDAVALTANAPAPPRDRDRWAPPVSGPGYAASGQTPAPSPPTDAAGKLCDSRFPKHTQKGCKE